MRRLSLFVVATAVAALTAGGASSHRLAGRCSDAGDRLTKLTLIERLYRNPEILILGSSRARTAEPSFLQRLTGRTGFNAAVTGGTAGDAWVMTRYTADRFRRVPRRHLWFVDIAIATNGLNPELVIDPRARRYLGEDGRAGTAACRLNSLYLADGSIAHRVSSSRRDRASVLAKSVASTVANIRLHPPQARSIDPRRYVYFERTIAFMNRHGSRPVIVVNPIHPRVLAELEKYGYPARETARTYFDQLRRRLDFIVVDCQDTRAWGGSASHFVDATHVDRVNMRRLLAYVVDHSDGVLRRRAG
jgi:hypothetical protein